MFKNTFYKKSSVAISHEYKEILVRLERIENKLEKAEKTEEKIEKKEEQIKQEEERMERVITQIGNFTFRRRHLLEGIRGTAGAFLGAGLGRGLLNMEQLASSLPWWKVVGLLVFILCLCTLLLYKSLRKDVEKKGWNIIWTRLFSLYLISLVVEFFALWLFGGMPSTTENLIKILIIGSYSAMAGAVSLLVI
jgi:hypothetical protein